MSKIIKLIILYIIIFLLMIGCCYVFSSCTTTRHLKSLTKDSVQVVKVDSGRVTVNTNTKIDSLAWWREIVNYLPKGHDTIINNTTIPVNNYYPAQIIREGGTAKSVSNQINYDSLWNNKIDSLIFRISQNQKDTKTTVLGFWQIIGLCSGVCLVFLLISKLKIGLK